MSIVRYRQWQSEPVISDGLRQMIDSLGRVAPGQRSDVWVPAVDIVDEPARVLLQVDLPGIDPAAIELLVEGNELILRGQRDLPAAAEPASVLRRERRQGSFERRFVLPDTVDGEQVTAHGQHGVLQIVLPKKALAGPRRISVAQGPATAGSEAVVATDGTA